MDKKASGRRGGGEAKRARRAEQPVEFSLVEDDAGRVAFKWADARGKMELSVKKDTLESAFVQAIAQTAMLIARNTYPPLARMPVLEKKKRGD